MAVSLMHMSYTAYKIKAAEQQGKKDFYTAEAKMDELLAKMQAQVSESIAEAHSQTLIKYSSICGLDITVTDKNGRVCTDYEGEIECTVWGAELMGIYSANPCNEDDYTSNKCHTFKGRALAVLRAKNKGKVSITVYNDELSGATFSVNAVEKNN
jgi:hypothetical protein